MAKSFTPRAAVESYVKRADQSAAAARILFDGGLYEDCVSRAYYSMYYAAKAALLTQDVSPKTHKGLVMKFGERIIKLGKMDREQLRELSTALRIRLKSDYELEFEITKEEVSEQLSNAEDFVESVKRFLKSV